MGFIATATESTVLCPAADLADVFTGIQLVAVGCGDISLDAGCNNNVKTYQFIKGVDFFIADVPEIEGNWKLVTFPIKFLYQMNYETVFKSVSLFLNLKINITNF